MSKNQPTPSATPRPPVPDQRDPGRDRAAAPGAAPRTAPPAPSATHRTAVADSFRGRFGPGWLQLPADPLDGTGPTVTCGLASRPVLLKNVGSTHRIPANTPWAVPGDGTWRVVTTTVTDLRLIHSNGAVIGAPTSARHPIRFDATSERALRAAITAATPCWVDSNERPINDLAAITPVQGRHAVLRPADPTQEHDAAAAFVMLATVAFERRPRSADPRLDRIVEYIDAHLADPALSTDAVATGCGLSRRTLQNLMAGQGGVASYLRRRRLDAALRLFATGRDQVPDLDHVAQAVGLGSRRTLERAMRQTYGLTPRQARAQVLAGIQLRPRPTEALRAS